MRADFPRTLYEVRFAARFPLKAVGARMPENGHRKVRRATE